MATSDRPHPVPEKVTSLHGKKVTLTFDNGPHPGVTENVLDVLDALAIKSTFFVVGQRLVEAGMLDLTRRAHTEGHWIGNHTYTHSLSLGDSDDPQVLEHEIGRTQDLLAELSHPDRLFRPRGAGGSLDHHLLSTDAVHYLGAKKYSMVLWNSVPRDWEYPDGWEERCRHDIESLDWGVVVLHDMPTGAMNGLRGVLQRMLDDGIEFVQEFPDSCVPIKNGDVCSPIDHLISTATTKRSTT